MLSVNIEENKNMLFSKHHIWVDIIDDTAKIGITEYAQEKLRSILFINLPDVEEEFSVNDNFGDIESVKTVIDLQIPVAGTVIAVNEELVDEPERINDAPYDSWFIKVKMTEKSEDLMTESEYEGFIKKL